MDTSRERTAPYGYFRLSGYDRYDCSDYFIGDYTDPDLAIQEARERAATPNGSPTSFSDIFYVYDDLGVCRYRVTHDDLLFTAINQFRPPNARSDSARIT
jgi:hypothetical protein